MGKNKSQKNQIDNGDQDVVVDTEDQHQDTTDASVSSEISANEAEQSDQQMDTESVEESSGLVEELEYLKKEVTEHFDRFQRLSAEYANYQKRKDQEIERARKFAIDQFARAMLDVMESMDQACDIEQLEDSAATLSAMREGIDLTRKQLLAAFEQFSIEEINPQIGVAFDANFHQAMTVLPNVDIPPNHISEVFRKGYTLHERLLRPAMVVVASEVKDQSE